MKAIKITILIFLLAGLMQSCIERYYPNTEINFDAKLVVDGVITADDGVQEIVVSKSAPLENPKIQFYSKCIVTVEDSKGAKIVFKETARKGHYQGSLDSGVSIGNKYRLRIVTPDGKEYLSQYEQLMPCPDVSFVYYEIQSRPTTNKAVTENGLQFYIDFKADANYGRFFRWQLVQTYEYHSTWPLSKWLDTDGYHILRKADYSNFYCYKTDTLGDIYTLSTAGLSQNNFTKYKLHYIPDQTQVLQHRYSLLIRQLSLTESAYSYWEGLRKNNQENADLFGKQPANVIGNIRNVKDTTDVALGYFSVSALRTKRIIVDPMNGLHFDNVFRCRAIKPDGPLTDERPLYFADDEDYLGVKYTGTTNPECIFCTMLGGTTVKPSYWDQK